MFFSPPADDREIFDQSKSSSSSSIIHTHKQSQLEREAGRRAKAFLTHDEMAARHPALKNAPMEGSYAKGMQVNHKPFNEVVRYGLYTANVLYVCVMYKFNKASVRVYLFIYALTF